VATQLRIAMGQLNLLVGAVAANADKIAATVRRARDDLHADAVVFPELGITGYPPEDLLQRPGLYTQARRALDALAREAVGIDVVVGYPYRDDSGVYNAAAVLRDGRVAATYQKQCLPNYSVFDEKRYFTPGDTPCVVDIKGAAVGITICEDAWFPGPIHQAVQAGARLVININASPYHIGKGEEREAVVGQRVLENRVPVLYVNQVGGQDELVFDGESFVMDDHGKVVQRCPAFVEILEAVDFEVGDHVTPQPGRVSPYLSVHDSVYKALVLGVRDYIEKNRFKGAIVGVSGGVDSALTLVIAVDAIGAEHVEALLMPSRYTSDMSKEDSQALCRALGVKTLTVSIDPPFNAFLGQLEEVFRGLTVDATEENIQARCRGVILMAVSNKFGKLVLTTGNKSEMSVGYATLYGDMAGGFAVIKDVSKTMVYELANYRNRQSPVIPNRIIERPPSAELAPNQKDEDFLPSYSVLDPILELYIAKDMGVDDIVARGFDEETVKRVVNMVQHNEYKRRQAPPGVRVTRRAFGRDRRYPITSGFTDK
jgi:NAD+ synthase (glutamine-hydrolysing)